MCECSSKKACCKVLIGVIILIALVLALTISFVNPANQKALSYVIFASRFFDVMIPILAVGALLKYLLCHKGCCCGEGSKKDSCGK